MLPTHFFRAENLCVNFFVFSVAAALVHASCAHDTSALEAIYGGLSLSLLSWGVLFSHPADYTPVCTTELGVVAQLMPEFEKRKVKVIALSCDPVETHKGWIKDIQVCTLYSITCCSDHL